MNIIPLISAFAEDLLSVSDKFFLDPESFECLEKETAEISQRTSARFLEMVLNEMDELLRRKDSRKSKYTIQRRDTRTLITTVGDVSYTHTLFKSQETGECEYLLDRLMKQPARERFSSQAEAKVLIEAQKGSYQRAADALKIGEQKISRTAVMEKVHRINEELMPEKELLPIKKKCCDYLYIEADEDHIHSQDADYKRGLIGKLVYIFEGKDEVGKNRKALRFPYYMGGLYQGGQANAQLWKEVDQYIQNHYDTDFLKRVYISGDGGGWIKAGTDYVGKSVFVTDRYHLMSYINRVSRCTLDEEGITKKRFYKYIYQDKLIAAKKLLTRIQRHCDGSDKAVEECRTFFTNNWDAIQRAFHDKHVLGCSAEGHVSHVYSDRMSSRPMAWSIKGSDKMCRLRCFVRNEGEESVIDLVKYRRERVLKEQSLLATGTDDAVVLPQEEIRKRKSKARKQLEKYYDAMQASLGTPSGTVRKILAIRNRINDI